MNIQVIYGTISGHSRKLAKAIADQLGITSEDIKNKPVLKGVDLLFVVGGVYGGKFNEKILGFLDEVDASQVKKVALVRSAVSQSALLVENPLRELLQKKQIAVETEEYNCRGSFLYFIGRGHPNQEDLEHLAEYAKRVAAASSTVSKAK